MSTLWSTTIARVGSDAAVMIDSGVLVLFGEPCPAALADVSVVHSDAEPPSGEIAPGDVVRVGSDAYTITAVGPQANANLADLGHVSLYMNQPEQQLLDGAILAEGPPLTVPEVGVDLVFLRPADGTHSQEGR